MSVNNTLPPNHQLVFQLDILESRKSVIKINLLALVLSLPLMVFFTAAIYLLREDNPKTLFTAAKSSPASTLYFLLTLAAIIILHEGVHGLFFWYYSKARPEFGLKLPLYAYAAMPGWYFPRNAFLTIALAPLVIISALGLLLIPLLPKGLVLFTFLLLLGNAAGAAGDLYMAFILLRYPPDSLVEDTRSGFKIYRPAEM